MIETLISGGITGLAGTIWSSWNKRRIREMELDARDRQNRHDLAMIKAESDAAIAEARADIRIEGARVAGEIELAETRAFAESRKADRDGAFDASYMERLFTVDGKLRGLAVPAGVLLALFFGVLDLVKGFARPGITVYLLGITTWVTARAWHLLDRLQGSALTAPMAAAIVSDAMNVVLYLTVSSVTWWFGDRMAAKGMAKNLKPRGTHGSV